MSYSTTIVKQAVSQFVNKLLTNLDFYCGGVFCFKKGKFKH